MSTDYKDLEKRIKLLEDVEKVRTGVDISGHYKSLLSPSTENIPSDKSMEKTRSYSIISGYMFNFNEPPINVTFWHLGPNAIFVKMGCIMVSSTEVQIFTKMCEDFDIDRIIHVDQCYLELENLQQIVKTLEEIANEKK